MKKHDYKNAVKTTLVIAIIWSFTLPLGIIGIVFGAVNGITALLVVGIVLGVLGFYGTPLWWVQYGTLESRKGIYYAITEDGETDIMRLCGTLGYTQQDVVKAINYFIKKRYLVGYVFDGKTITMREPTKAASRVALNKCPSCGATLEEGEDKLYCPYCGSKFNK